jgi:hypothetical protein
LALGTEFGSALGKSLGAQLGEKLGDKLGLLLVGKVLWPTTGRSLGGC